MVQSGKRAERFTGEGIVARDREGINPSPITITWVDSNWQCRGGVHPAHKSAETMSWITFPALTRTVYSANIER